MPGTQGTFQKRIPLEAGQLLRAKPAIRGACPQEAVVLTRGLAPVFRQKPAQHTLGLHKALGAPSYVETAWGSRSHALSS